MTQSVPGQPGSEPTRGTGVPPVSSEKVTRRNLPHMQVKGHTYFLTWRCRNGTCLSPAERTIVLLAIKHWDRTKWNIIAAVVMPDHVHVLATPLSTANGAVNLTEVLHSVKSFTAHEIARLRNHRIARIWQDETYDRIVRDEAELEETYEYIRYNPVKSGLVVRSDRYDWLLDFENHRRDAGATSLKELVRSSGFLWIFFWTVFARQAQGGCACVK